MFVSCVNAPLLQQPGSRSQCSLKQQAKGVTSSRRTEEGQGGTLCQAVEWDQRRAELVKGLEAMSREERPRELGLCWLERRRLRGSLMAPYTRLQPSGIWSLLLGL